MKLHPLSIAALGVVAAVVLGGLLAVLIPVPERTPAVQGETPVAVPIGGPFTLTNGEGKTVTEKDFAGRYMLVFFGFTHCPDICPTTLEHIGRTLVALGGDAKAITPVFISVDPERDTPETVSDYAQFYDKRIVGLTGTPEQVAAAAKTYKVYFQKVELGGGDYTIDHSTLIYLMGPDGKFRAVLRTDDPPEAVAAQIAEVLRADRTG